MTLFQATEKQKNECRFEANRRFESNRNEWQMKEKWKYFILIISENTLNGMSLLCIAYVKFILVLFFNSKSFFSFKYQHFLVHFSFQAIANICFRKTFLVHEKNFTKYVCQKDIFIQFWSTSPNYIF